MKYRVYGIMTASVLLGEYEADSPEEAERMSDADPNANLWPSLCHECSNEIDLGDIYETQVEASND